MIVPGQRLPCRLQHAQRMYTGAHVHTQLDKGHQNKHLAQLPVLFALTFLPSAMSISTLNLIKFHLPGRIYKGQRKNLTHIFGLMSSLIL